MFRGMIATVSGALLSLMIGSAALQNSDRKFNLGMKRI
jgi:hypothetical protein